MSGWGHVRVRQTDRETRGRREAREEKRQGREEEARKERGVKSGKRRQKSKLCLAGTFEGCICRIVDMERHLGPGLPALEADAGCCCSGN